MAGSSDDNHWPQWRGPNRDGIAAWLPDTLAGTKLKWKHPLPSKGIGGIAATDEFVFVTSRDRQDAMDVVSCLDAETGIVFWQDSYQAPGKLDYGNSIRATPLVADPLVITQGAFGDLRCYDLESGDLVWSKHLVRDLQGIMPQWGYSATPIVVNDALIVQPGGEQASIVALDLRTGDLRWATPGRQAAYASLIEWNHEGQHLVIGFDYRAIVAWNVADGKRIWEHMPKVKNDFHVPTPVLSERGLIATSENNGTRLLSWNATVGIGMEPQAKYEELAGDSHSPIRMGRFLVGVDRGLHVLDIEQELKPIAVHADPNLDGYCSVIGCEDRALVLCESGVVLLFRIGEQGIEEIGRTSSVEEGGQVLAHPAIAGRTLFVRSSNSLQAWHLP